MAYGVIGLILIIVMLLLIAAFFRADEEEKKQALSLGITILMFVIGGMAYFSTYRVAGYLLFFIGFLMVLHYLEQKGLLPSGFGTLKEHREEEPKDDGKSAEVNLMSRKEAYKVLGLTEKPTKAEVRAAHKKLMMKHHPDKEGNHDIAAKLNAARETLLRDE